LGARRDRGAGPLALSILTFTNAERSGRLGELKRSIQETQNVAAQNDLLNPMRRGSGKNDWAADAPRLSDYHFTSDSVSALSVNLGAS
jgi:hypothetical protein